MASIAGTVTEHNQRELQRRLYNHGWRLRLLPRSDPRTPDGRVYLVTDPRWELTVFGDPAGTTLTTIHTWLEAIETAAANETADPPPVGRQPRRPILIDLTDTRPDAPTASTDITPRDTTWADHRMHTAVDELCQQFPSVPRDVITSMLGDSYRVVVEASGLGLVGKAEDLTRTRLEVRTHHPALTG